MDGNAGRLIYRGYLIQDLASRATFEEVAYLLLFEKLPSRTELLDFKGRLSREREVHADLIAALKTRPSNALAMDVLQAAVSMLANHDPELPQSSQDGAIRMAIRLIAKQPPSLPPGTGSGAAWNPLSPIPGWIMQPTFCIC